MTRNGINISMLIKFPFNISYEIEEIWNCQSFEWKVYAQHSIIIYSQLKFRFVSRSELITHERLKLNRMIIHSSFGKWNTFENKTDAYLILHQWFVTKENTSIAPSINIPVFVVLHTNHSFECFTKINCVPYLKLFILYKSWKRIILF